MGSLKYSPVYKSLCCAFGKACEEEGYPARYLFSREYEWMLPKKIREKTIFIGNSVDIASMLIDGLSFKNVMLIRGIFSKDRPDHVYLHNYHFLNHYIAKTCRRHGGKFICHVHEPFVENKSAHGGLQHYWLYLDEYMEGRLLQDTAVAIVSSREASRLFDQRFSWFQGKKIEIPLIYEDLGEDIDPVDKRKYVTFVGPPVPAKGPEIFLRIVDYAAKHDMGWSFLLISRSKLNDPRFHKKKNLEIFYKTRISDEEFGSLIRKSLVVLTPYKRETQSAVILASYMYGTPVVSTNVGGLPEFVGHKKTGYLVDKDASIGEWVDGISYVLENLCKLSMNCRNHFVESFSGKTWRKYLKDVLV